MSVCVPGVPVVVVVVDRPRYMRFVFSLCHHRLALLLPLLLPSRIFSFPARSALLRRSQEPFYVKPHRVAHTHTCENDDNEAMGLTLENCIYLFGSPSHGRFCRERGHDVMFVPGITVSRSISSSNS